MKYRIPIMKRTPFVIRRSIVHRSPVVSRIAVINRTPVPVKNISYTSCKLMTSCVDCKGFDYTPTNEVLAPMCIFRLVRVSDTDNKEQLIDKIQGIKNEGAYIRLVTDKPLPAEVVTSLMYSPFNIIQYNINCMDNVSRGDMKKSLAVAKNCGLYTSVLFYPIIPTIIKVSYILSMLEEYHSLVNYFCLNFLSTHGVLPQNYGGHYNINGYLVPDKYMTYNKEGGIQCNESYLSDFITVLNSFVRPRKINVILCNNATCY